MLRKAPGGIRIRTERCIGRNRELTFSSKGITKEELEYRKEVAEQYKKWRKEHPEEYIKCKKKKYKK